MRDILWDRMFTANLCYANIGGFASFGECIVAAIKVFAFLNCPDFSVMNKRKTCLGFQVHTLSLF